MNIQASNGVMTVGHQFDNLATVIDFPIQSIYDEYGSTGSFNVRIQRNGDVAAYPTSNFVVANGKLSLTLTASDMNVVGEGKIQIKYTVGSIVKMSRVYKFYSHFSLSNTETVPQPWVSWVDEVEENADRAEEAVEHYPYIDSTTKTWWTWDVENEQFVDTEVSAKGEKGDTGEDGEDGADGVTFTPSVDAQGNISWTNDGGRENPASRNIKGPQGETGATGPQGPKGDTGKAFTIDVTYPTVAAMEADFNNRQVGDYAMIQASVEQVDNAKLYYRNTTQWDFMGDFSGATGIQGPQGPTGLTGTTFTPSVSAEGIISWTNDGGKTNPEAVDIKGPRGNTGSKGDTGTTYTPNVSDQGVISWSNDGGKPNPNPVNIKGPQGATGPTAVSVNGSVVNSVSFNSDPQTQINAKQNETDISLNTTNKQIVPAINEVKNTADSKSVVSVNASGSATDVINYITINGVEKKLPSGGGCAWGEITGTLSNQTDLANALNAKANTADVNREDSKLQRRVSNLEGQAPASTTIEYPDTTYLKGDVPTGVCKYASLEKVKGKTIKWNQLLNSSNLPDVESDFTNGVKVSAVDRTNGAVTITVDTGGATANVIKFITQLNVPISHKGCVIGCPSGGGISTYRINVYNSSWVAIGDGDDGNGMIFTATSAIDKMGIVIWNGCPAGTYTFKPQLFDLTAMGIADQITTVADFKALFPNDYYPYDAGSLKSATVSGAWSQGVNIWDEVWEVGDYNNTGSKIASSDRIRSKNKIGVLPNTSYFIKASRGGGAIYYYDNNEAFISYLGGQAVGSGVTFTTPTNCFYITFATYANYGSTYLNDIQICLDSYSAKTTYHPHTLATMPFPQTLELKGAGTASDEYVPETGVVTRPLAKKTLNGSEDWLKRPDVESGSVFYYGISPSAKNNGSVLTKDYIQTTISASGIISTDMAIALHRTLGIEIHDNRYADANAFKSYLNNNPLEVIYELDTPTTEQLTPIDQYIEVEAEGTVGLTHTETPATESKFIMEYANLQ